MARYLVEVPVIHRVFVLVESDSEQEALEIARYHPFNEEDVVNTVVDTDVDGVVGHGIYID